MTLVNVGSINPIKITAVKNQFKDFPDMNHPLVVGIEIDSGVRKQPLSIGETLQGARNRAVGVYKKGLTVADFGIGIESGLFKLNSPPYYDVCVCAIYDGKDIYTGIGPAFEIPEKLNPFIEDGHDLNEACLKAGITKKEKLGNEEGLIGILTKGRVNRLQYTEQAIAMALFHIL